MVYFLSSTTYQVFTSYLSLLIDDTGDLAQLEKAINNLAVNDAFFESVLIVDEKARVIPQDLIMREDMELTSDGRIIAATNRNLWDMVQKGEFREDLYYRLNIIGVKLPSLYERIEDISGMINQFLDENAKEHNRTYTMSQK